ncbi:hypothetical protein NEOKW01_1095 [Nematocida sp. AWRm80]|nr:hypothetical protein NEOKW01_1095 [Nematocida sp. AWRm80]
MFTDLVKIINSAPKDALYDIDKLNALIKKGGIDTVETCDLTNTTYVFKYTSDYKDLKSIPALAKVLPQTTPEALIVRVTINVDDPNTDERYISLLVDHPNVVRTYFAYEDTFDITAFDIDDSISLLITFMEPLSVSVNIKSIHGDEERIRTIIHDVLLGLKYLHGIKIAHLDLKAQNVMGVYSKEAGRVVYKIIDLGYAQSITESSQMKYCKNHAYGTDPFKPPESMLESLHGFASDIWCVGYMAAVMASGTINIFEHTQNPGVLREIESSQSKLLSKRTHFLHQEIRLQLKNTISPILVHFIHKCMARTPAKRWTVNQLLSHPFIQNIPNSPEANTITASDYYIY